MTTEQRFPVEPWCLREVGFDRADLAQTESLFALSNGHIGIRGNLDEGDPNGLPGTYLNSFYESRPLPYAEAGYGYPESGQSVVNVTDGKLIRLLVEDEPFDLRYGEVLSHERVLDLRRGVLRRTVEWCSPSGIRVRVKSTRLVSLTRRSIVAINYSVEPLDRRIGIVVQSELVANEDVPRSTDDPRVAAALDRPLVAVEHGAAERRAMLVHRTAASKLNLAVAMDNYVTTNDDPTVQNYATNDRARFTVATEVEPGEPFGLTKFVAYGWSSERSVPNLRDQVDAALTAAGRVGWDGVEQEQADAWAEFWDGADVDITGADDIQQAVRFGLFHSLQAAVRAERRAVPAQGHTGTGYDGHAFWDTEAFVLPVLTATAPSAAADALRWRHSTLDLAIERAATLGFDGAAFPWRTIRGQECSGYWPAGTAALHVNADIAVAAMRYVRWTGDDDFERDHALPLLVQTARLWASVGSTGEDGRFHIDGVTGPDEYSAIVDDNAFTNLMAAANLGGAAAAARRWPQQAEALDVAAAEIEAWQQAADTVAVPFDHSLDVHQQDEGFTHHAVWDFERSARTDGYPLLLNAPYFEIYRKQVVKQADLMLAMHWASDRFTPEEKAKAFAYYDPLTVRDSSLSACTQAVIAAEVGQHDLAADYLAEAALMDLHDLEHNTRDGLHIASLAGTWIAVVAGFGGLRDVGGVLSFRPQLAPGWELLEFHVRWRDTRVRVTIREGTATYE
ncbi:MAG: glycoside hydrolase family 65 protein, partial [Jatrophihabitans sp.]|uniref:glycoside hydrolase family 65 protein n=1 Tax=Jatrophihabitans sp. TaxID=1932789 RepID=UPI003F7FE8AF